MIAFGKLWQLSELSCYNYLHWYQGTNLKIIFVTYRQLYWTCHAIYFSTIYDLMLCIRYNAYHHWLEIWHKINSWQTHMLPNSIPMLRYQSSTPSVSSCKCVFCKCVSTVLFPFMLYNVWVDLYYLYFLVIQHDCSL